MRGLYNKYFFCGSSGEFLRQGIRHLTLRKQGSPSELSSRRSTSHGFISLRNIRVASGCCTKVTVTVVRCN